MIRQGPIMSRSADLIFDTLSGADTSQLHPSQLLMPAHLDSGFVPRSAAGSHATNCSVAGLSDPSSLMNSLVLAAPRQVSVERLLDLETGRMKAIPPRRRHRRQTAEELANRELIKRLGGACCQCKKKKRQVP